MGGYGFMKDTKCPYSIRKILVSAFRQLHLWLLVPVFLLVLFTLLLVNNYNQCLQRITNASEVSRLVSEDVVQSTWSVVSGRTESSYYDQYQTLSAIRFMLQEIDRQTSAQAEAQYIATAVRAVDTLEDNISRLQFQLSRNDTVWENELRMMEIENVAEIIQAQMQELSYSTAVLLSEYNTNINRVSQFTILIILAMLLFSAGYSLRTVKTVTELIEEPVGNMREMAQKFAIGDLSARIPLPRLEELDGLAHSLNAMAEQNAQYISHRLESQREIQKAEMRLLQAQIMPHFLYNTLDTIVWLAEEKRNENVIDLTIALTNYLRTTLNQGMDFTTLDREILHVQSYLSIQAFRYQNVLDYEICVAPDIQDAVVLKLLLQPLVENAIYHGIRMRRGKGKIIVRAEKANAETLRLSVSDNGIGMGEETLEKLNAQLYASSKAPEKGFGLWNIAQRLNLYYAGSRLCLESGYQKGTTVSFSIPLQLSAPMKEKE